MKMGVVSVAVGVSATAALTLLPIVLTAQPRMPIRSCAVIETIVSWNPVDQWTLVVGAQGSNYRVTFAGACHHMKWSVLARVEARPTVNRCLAAGDAVVFGRGVRRGDGRFQEENRCVVSSVQAIDTKPPQALKYY